MKTETFIKKFSEGYNRSEIVKNLINNNFSCYLISPFRELDNTGQDEVYLKNFKKLKWKEISTLNLDDLLFGRDKDLFILFFATFNIFLSKSIAKAVFFLLSLTHVAEILAVAQKSSLILDQRSFLYNFV